MNWSHNKTLGFSPFKYELFFGDKLIGKYTVHCADKAAFEALLVSWNETGQKLGGKVFTVKIPEKKVKVELV